MGWGVKEDGKTMGSSCFRAKGGGIAKRGLLGIESEGMLLERRRSISMEIQEQAWNEKKE